MSAIFTADEILYATKGHLKSGSVDDEKNRIVWDLRDLRPGDWFIAIPSQLQDPHDHLKLALEMGARGLIVNRRRRFASAPKGTTIISVPETMTALWDIARYWRHYVQPRVVGVTGSSGRRATMVLLSQLLKDDYRTHLAFMGKFGHFGCIEAVLSMPRDTQVLIFEAGAVERGDISRIGGSLDPDLAVLTQIRHPLPSPERDAFIALLYCELLETLSDSPSDSSNDQLSAVIYDENPAVQRRLEEVLVGLTSRKYSQSEGGIAKRVSEQALKALSEAMESTQGLSVSRSELWCAVEAAKALGLSEATLEKVFEVESEVVVTDSGAASLRQTA